MPSAINSEPSLFLQLPDLVREKITSNLKISHLLNLRLVCCKTNEWALEELKSSMKSKYVYLNPQNIQEFNSTVTSLAFKSFCLAFRPPQLHTDPHILKFLGNFASSLETLAVPEFHECRSQEELSFYNRLISLKSLIIHKIPLGNSSIPPRESRLPLNCLRSLRSVQILSVENSFYHLDLIERLPVVSLEHLELPEVMQSIKGFQGGNFNFAFNWLFPGVFDRMDENVDTTNRDSDSLPYHKVNVHARTVQSLVTFLETREKVFSGSSAVFPKLAIDLRRHLLVDEVSEEVKVSEVQLLKLMRRQNVKLKVTKELINSFGGRYENSPKTLSDLAGCVETLEGFPINELLAFEGFQRMESLKQLGFRTGQPAVPGNEKGNVDVWNGTEANERRLRFLRPFWPNLRSIIGVLEVDDKSNVEGRVRDFLKVYNFLFRSERVNGHLARVEHIKLILARPVGTWLGVNPEDFLNFKCLKRLSLEVGLPSSVFYVFVHILSEHSKGLEELVWNSAESLHDKMFVCCDKIPPLLRFKRLRSLEVSRETITNEHLPLAPSTGLTDLPFKSVFKKMNLSVLKLNGVMRSKVTLQGILEVLNGERMQTSLRRFELNPQMEQDVAVDLKQDHLSARSVFKLMNDLVERNKKIAGHKK